MSRNSSSRSRCGRRGEEKSEIKYNLLDMNRRNGISILGRMLAPVSRSLNAAAARKLLDVKADAQTQKRVNTLARKCNEGELTPSERAEYEWLVTAGNVIAVLQAEARLRLAKNR